ncbi:MAG: HAD family hydrolase [Sphingomonas bacterium]
MIEAVLFDLDETLLDRTGSLRAFLADQYTRHSARLGDVPMPVWRDRFLTLDRRGMVHKSVVYAALLAEFGGDTDAADPLLADYRARCPDFARPIDGMEMVLRELRARRLPLGIVTNGETAFQSAHIRALGIDRLVDTVLISEAEGLRKPEAALFLRAADRLGVAPAQCLFVGDNPVADVMGATRAGMQGVWLREEGQDWPVDLSPPGGSISGLAELLEMLS